MQSYLTEHPVTVEIRNDHGDVHVELTDTDTTTVHVTAVAGHPFGFIDDLLTTFPGAWHRSAGRTGGGSADRADRADRADGADSAAGKAVERVRVDYELIPNDGGLLIVDTRPAAQNWRAAFAVTVTAPTGSGVRIASRSADVTVTGTAGHLDVGTASGDVNLETVAGTCRAHSASGDIRLADAGSDIDLRTASGDVNVGRVAGKAKVHSTSGDIKIDAVVGDIDVRGVSGDVRIGAATTGTAQIAAVSGDVEIGVTAGRRAAIDLSTISGDTRTDFPVLDKSADNPDDPETAASLHISVRTTSGDIRLCRAA